MGHLAPLGCVVQYVRGTKDQSQEGRQYIPRQHIVPIRRPLLGGFGFGLGLDMDGYRKGALSSRPPVVGSEAATKSTGD
eukprot:419394-Pyramimonas_sp.AAC.1